MIKMKKVTYTVQKMYKLVLDKKGKTQLVRRNLESRWGLEVGVTILSNTAMEDSLTSQT